MHSKRWSVVIALAALVALEVSAAEFNPVLHPAPPADLPATTQVVVKLRTGSVTPTSADVVALANRVRLQAHGTRPITDRLHVLEFTPASSGEPLAVSLAHLRADPTVEYAEVDQRRYPHAVPNDPGYGGQWFLQANSSTVPAALNATAAWDTTTGSTGVVIAVIDTGVRYDHPDLLRSSQGGRLLPGFDFITNVQVANDGDGWDADASDPGDWITQSDLSLSVFSKCTVGNSSWHGTRVSGIVGALTNNGAGIAGIGWYGWILPVRALGKCGGSDSDIVSAMLWAGGIHVSGAPDNPYPAKIENLSFGAADSTCPAIYQDAITQLTARGVLIVASAGNEGGAVDAPGMCAGVVAVAGLRHAGTKVGFSSLGPQIALSAPGGNCVNTTAGSPCLYSLDTTYNLGTQSPGTNAYTDQYNTNLGTSFSAPIVSSIAGLMLAVNGNLTPAQLRARLQEGTSRPFPVSTSPGVLQCVDPATAPAAQTSECNCTTSTCGAGMANAAGSVAAALRPIAAVAPPASVLSGQSITLAAGASAAACGHSIASYAWSVAPGSPAVALTGASTASVSFTAPAAGVTDTLQLVVTDDAGRTDTATVAVTSNSANSTAPVSAGTTACLATLSVDAPALGFAPTAAVVPVSTAQAPSTRAFTTALDPSTLVWSVNGVTGGNSTLGTISTSGVYSAPTTLPSPATVTIKAQSVVDASRSGTAAVTITSGQPVTVSISPSSASLQAGTTQSFSATVANSSNTAVTWQVNGVTGGSASTGTVSSAGLFTAPASVATATAVTVTAVSAADTGTSASAQVTVNPAPVVASSGGGSHGGGAIGLVTLLQLGCVLLLRSRRRFITAS